MANSTSDLMGGRLAHSVATGRLDGLEIEFWKGGGLPPPHYVSDQLRLMTQGNTEVVEFASIKWDDHFDPPNVQEKWIVTARPHDVHDIAQLMESTNFLNTAYSEETKPNIADCFSYEILLTYQGRQEKKTYYQKLPEQLGPLGTMFEKLISFAKTQGSRALYHKGNKVSD